MIIAISANKDNMKSLVSQHFGRCEWFCLYNTESKEYSFIENPLQNQQENAGHDVAELLINRGVNTVIAGRFGSKVMAKFIKLNIQMIIPESPKTIIKIINQLKLE
ncbi:NifB/NifX family molybdenum-iron cluster-binding protein [uncultured Bacteroides sp.]|uniref:NifB/NifX family molybdenum-iron cluster-binding protein n=1 Tax=uncultured Bacteroides sp. TaxID=162156 RepID=UPI002AA68E08|nr:NifB/NifX family molybdenum-iron cluster-binding protein [uncultured Bacteroides sp.]